MLYIFVLLFGLVTGSFLGALTYRMPRGISILKGRSFCPHCKEKIAFYDNIPLLSFIMLSGKCRRCAKYISLREPTIELLTAILFLLVYYFSVHCTSSVNNFFSICKYTGVGFFLILLLELVVTSVLITVLIIDYEAGIIPDSLVFILYGFVLLFLILIDSPTFYFVMLSSFGVSLFFLFLHLFTHGSGMGLGDVKLALPIGLILSWPYTLVWLTSSFILGGLVSVILIILKRKTIKNHIAFAPFMITAFFIVFFLGGKILTFFRY